MAPKRGGLRADQRLLLCAASLAFVAWLLPVGRVVLLPLVFLNTHVHELGHALAAVATGGTVRQIAVLASGDGMTFALGGMPMVVASAGYIGASLLGAAMVYFGRTQRGARVALWSLAALISCGLLLWVRGDAVGVLAGATWALVLVVAGRLLKGAAVIMLAQFVGIVQCLSATDALLVLFRVSWAKDVHSDAQNMAQATGIGAPFWAATWLMLSAVLVYVSVRAAWRNAP